MSAHDQAAAGQLLDLNFLATYTGGDEALRDQVLEMFIDQANLLLERLQNAQGDERAWYEAAHSLKGCARGVGAGPVADLASQAQEEAASEIRQAELLAELSTALEATVAHIKGVVAGTRV